MLLRVFGCAPKHRFTETERRRDAAGRIGGLGRKFWLLTVDTRQRVRQGIGGLLFFVSLLFEI